MIDISVKDLVKSFDEEGNLLDSISFDVHSGERVGLLGKNGAGKTTLFKILTGEIDYNSGAIAMRELSEKYPERKLYAVDSLCASLGEGLFVDLCHEKKQAGMSIDELRDYAESLKLHICHWFTVNDLMFLKRGGRVSAATAIVGSVLNIKPVMHMDNEGHLIKVDVARGRKA